MKKKKKKISFDNSILPKKHMHSFPLYYRFLRRLPNDADTGIENLNKISFSQRHRSLGYHLEACYKPVSKFIQSNFF